MPIKTHTCLTATCDVCGEQFNDEYLVHCADLHEMRQFARDEGWLVTSDRQVICGTDDAAHQQAHDALLPPEPMPVPDGQLAIDEIDEGEPT